MPRFLVLDRADLLLTKERCRAGDPGITPAADRLRSEADAALNAGPFSVMDKEFVPPSGDKHDYVSMGGYWWPNPDTPDGLPYVRRDGEVNPEMDRLDRKPMADMRTAVETLALAYFLWGEERYAKHAARLLRTWFLDEATRMNPHLEFGQRIPGICEGRGIGICDTWALSCMVDYVAMLEGAQAWSSAEQDTLREWYRVYLRWLLSSENGKDESGQPNNHGTGYDMQVATLALAVGDLSTARYVLTHVPERRIATQIEPDGAQPLEFARKGAGAMGYPQGNLRLFFNLARLAEHVGVDLWHFETRDGRSLRKALDLLVAYACEERPWPYAKTPASNWAQMPELLRRAAAKFGEARCEKLIGALGDVDAVSSRFNLLYPAR